MLELFHFVHVISAVVYGGSAISFVWIIYPALHRMEPAARNDTLLSVGKLSTPVMATSGILLVLSGLARLWTGGAIGGLGDLFVGYGLLATTALAIVVVWTVFDSRSRVAIWKAAADHDTDAFGRLIRRDRYVSTLALFLILCLMISMRLGLY